MNKIEIPTIESITKTVEKIKASKISILDLTIEHIKRALDIQAKTNAFITIYDGGSNRKEYDPIARAKELEKMLASGLGQRATGSSQLEAHSSKLFGIPFTAKDLYLVENTKTTFGSKYMQDFIAPYTGTVIQKCFDEGGILIGKCNCDPWGFGGSGENSGFGPAHNPYDLDRTPGGSSSGSAASLSAGVGFFSLGTDTGGSVRQPASMTGLFGYKPTYGRNSRYGIGTMGSSFDTPGFFARNVEDLALLEEIMGGKDEMDPTSQKSGMWNVEVGEDEISSGSRVQSLEEEIRSEASGKNDDRGLMIDDESKKNIYHLPSTIDSPTSTLKPKPIIGVPVEFYGEGLDPEIDSAIKKQIEDLKNKGFEVKEVSVPSVKYSLSVYYVLVPAEISSNRARYDGVRFGPKVSENYEENLIKGRSQFFEDEVKRRIMIGTYVLSAGYGDQFYKKANLVRNKIKKEFEEVFKEVDVLITPTSPTTAFKLGEKTEDPMQMYLADIYTVTANIVGMPGLNVPIGFDSNGLPIGMQLMGKHWGDEEMFEFAKNI